MFPPVIIFLISHRFLLSSACWLIHYFSEKEVREASFFFRDVSIFSVFFWRINNKDHIFVQNRQNFFQNQQLKKRISPGTSSSKKNKKPARNPDTFEVSALLWGLSM